jgi:hypothetical protein
LLDEADHPAHVTRVERRRLDAVEQVRTPVIEEAHEHVREGRLAGAGSAAHEHSLTGREGEIHVEECRMRVVAT